jgi:excisionase family DNA binding protein
MIDPTTASTSIEQGIDATLERLLLPIVEKLKKRLELPPQEWFSIKETAALTGLSADHIRRAVSGGTLPCSNVGTNDRPTYRISRTDIAQWMERRKAGALPPSRRKKNPREMSLPVSPHLRQARQPA